MLILYVMVRTDAASMTPGRVAAQVAHAGTLAGVFYRNTILERCVPTKYPTTIVLDGGNLSGLPKFLEEVMEPVIDPAYAIKDDKVTHYTSFLTAKYWVLDTKDLADKSYIEELKKYPLYSG